MQQRDSERPLRQEVKRGVIDLVRGAGADGKREKRRGTWHAWGEVGDLESGRGALVGAKEVGFAVIAADGVPDGKCGRLLGREGLSRWGREEAWYVL